MPMLCAHSERRDSRPVERAAAPGGTEGQGEAAVP